jgi:signal transduction histidine kinase
VGGLKVSMRWWLAGAFVLIAVVTALLIEAVSSRQVGRDVTANARNIAIGETVSAAFAIQQARTPAELVRNLPAIRRKYGLALFVFARDGRLVAVAHGPRVGFASVPDGRSALGDALAGHRFAAAEKGGDATVVGLPLGRTPLAAGLVAFAPRPPGYGASLSIFRSEVARVSIWAVLGAAFLGFVLAALVTRRLRRIAGAAAAIEQGGFDTRLEPRFRDEVGDLAQTVDRMRIRLGDAFASVEAERDRLDLLLDSLHEGVIAVDRTLRVQYANVSIRRVLPELTTNAPLPETFADLPLRRIAAGLFEPGAPVAEARTDAADGATYSLVGVPATGTDLAVLALADITEHERRQRAEREFVANASHELRTPVSAIASAVEALELGARDRPEERDRFIELIGRQAGRLTRLTSSLLVLARAQTREQGVQLAPVAVAPLLESVVRTVGPSERLRVECEQGLSATAQADVLEQIVANLVENALKHGRTGEVLMRGVPHDGHLTIEVTDQGPGIGPELRGRVFDRFYAGTAEVHEGFGLGLAIARESAEALGARLEIASEPGRGTTASVTLPRA